MELEQLRKKKISDLQKIAEKFKIDTLDMAKEDLVKAILKAESKEQENGLVKCSGVLEILNEGFGFLRSPNYSYLPSQDDIYISPVQIKRIGLRSGDTVKARARPPRNSEKFFAVVKVDKVNDDFRPSSVNVCPSMVLPLFILQSASTWRILMTRTSLPGL